MDLPRTIPEAAAQLPQELQEATDRQERERAECPPLEPSTPTEAAQVKRAVECLQPYADEAQIAGLLGKLDSIAAPLRGGVGDQAAEDGKGRIEAALIETNRIAKSEDLPHETRERARKANLALQREHLAKVNPRAADRWDETWGVHHGVRAA